MLKKLHLIAQKLEPGRIDVWDAEMLYKLVNKDLADPYTIDYLQGKFLNPYKSLPGLIARLYNEALKPI